MVGCLSTVDGHSSGIDAHSCASLPTAQGWLGAEGAPPALSPSSGPAWPRADGTSQEQHSQRGRDFAGHCPSSGRPVAAVANDHRLSAFRQQRGIS